ncbi:tetratricopeptide repeat protein [bacterium]|nr:tetratricopeptide repeat protein [bacterium]
MARQQKRLKKQELREDPLMTALTNAQIWLAEHGKKLAIGVVVVAVVVVAVVMLGNMRTEADLESRRAFAEAQLELAQTNPEDMIPPLLRVADEYSGTSGGAEALYTAAEMALNNLDNERAAELFQRFLDEYSSEYLLPEGAMGGLATAYMNLGQYQEAADTYIKLANDKRASHYRYFALLNAAEAYVKLEQYDKAREVLNTVVEEKSATVSDFRTRAQEELARIDVLADSVGLP